MTCKKEEECFSAPDLVENTSGRERGSFLFMYRYLSKSHWMCCVGSLERGDCLCFRVSISKAMIKHQSADTKRSKHQITTSARFFRLPPSIVCLLFVYLFTGFGKIAVTSNRKKGKTLCARYNNRRNQSQKAGSGKRNKGETR